MVSKDLHFHIKGTFVPGTKKVNPQGCVSCGGRVNGCLNLTEGDAFILPTDEINEKLDKTGVTEFDIIMWIMIPSGSSDSGSSQLVSSFNWNIENWRTYNDTVKEFTLKCFYTVFYNPVFKTDICNHLVVMYRSIQLNLLF